MAQGFKVTGPVPISVGTGASGALEYLGLTEDEFQVEINSVYSDVMLNAAGEVPADKQYMGEWATFTVALHRYDEAVLKKLEARPNPAGTRGALAANMIGTLMITERYAFRVFLDMLYQSKAAFADMPPCYNFLKGFVEGPIIRPMGTKSHKPRLTFVCLPQIDYATFTSVLYNVIATGKPSYT